MTAVIPLQDALVRRCAGHASSAGEVAGRVARALERFVALAPASSRVYLGGSLGRGEPCLRPTADGGRALASDIDLQLVGEGEPSALSLAPLDVGAPLDVHVLSSHVFPRMGLLSADCVELRPGSGALLGEERATAGDAAELLAFASVEVMVTMIPWSRRASRADDDREMFERQLHRAVMYNLRAGKLSRRYATFLSPWHDADEPEVSRRHTAWRLGEAVELRLTDLWDSFIDACHRLSDHPSVAWRESLLSRGDTPARRYTEWIGTLALAAMEELAAARPEHLSEASVAGAWTRALSRSQPPVDGPIEQFFPPRFSAYKQALYDHKAFGTLPPGCLP